MKIEFLRIEKAYKEANMNTREIKAIPNTRHGIVKVDNKEYYFAANTAMKFPVVFGATAEEIYAVLQGLDNKMKDLDRIIEKKQKASKKRRRVKRIKQCVF